MVNVSAQPYKTSLKIEGAEVSGNARWIMLAADSPTAENTLKDPLKYIPRTTEIQLPSPLEIEVRPYSISVIRLKDALWKKAGP